ncbi:hypothetical protein DENSPDRAFT_831757 [Dentipellis sp. KUC8613]|nr:hypothetical protein DENSPDRAFT_831757 [Dentipellis sp. KUC8613]
MAIRSDCLDRLRKGINTAHGRPRNNKHLLTALTPRKPLRTFPATHSSFAMDAFNNEILFASSAPSVSTETTQVPTDLESSGSGGHSYCVIA